MFGRLLSFFLLVFTFHHTTRLSMEIQNVPKKKRERERDWRANPRMVKGIIGSHPKGSHNCVRSFAVYAKGSSPPVPGVRLNQRNAWMMSLGLQNLEMSSRQITKFRTWDMSRDVDTETLSSCKMITPDGLNAIRWEQRKHRKRRLVCRGFIFRAKSLTEYARTTPKSS